ncbi:C-5 cytosine-specific DNA methylase [Ruegeria lacuscaerulensis ITI-1157]|nr:C-5 cytosine-specific DNA methylase [Ruegeria lacuscaerulensis ITI-1157]SHK04495.1 DNA (cytosine-5)-methyltransferase 1 [Ruegeria lacuscaerulensis ITI-1157]
MTDLPMIIDSFAGGGGASTGIEIALGRSPDVAINHSAAALALHKANHPYTLHLDSNIWDVDPLEIANGRKVGLLWASPDCKHFSRASGKALKDRNIRDLAWVIVDWAEKVKPDVILMENVEEFQTWGPVGEDGRPVKEFAGMTFELWVKRLKKAGYKLQWKALRGCDYGAPTIRKRFFMVARRDGRPIVWPKPTHGDPKSPTVKKGRLLPWRTAAECIDWSIPCPSIFMTKEEAVQYGKENDCNAPKRPLTKNTLARIARGMGRYVLNANRPFVVNLTHGGRVEDAADPFKTITGANRGEKSVVVPSITRFNSGAIGVAMDEPMPTVTANSWIKKPGGAAPLGMIAPHLMTMRNAQKPYNGADEPAHTITAGGARLCEVAPYLMSLKGSARRDSAPGSPHPTVLAGGGHSSVVAPILTYAQQGGSNRSLEEPTHTITASKKDYNAVIAPMLVQAGYGERPGQAPRSLDPFAPLGTVVAGGIKHAPAAAFLAQHNKARDGVNPGRPVDAPISTLTMSGSQQTVVAPWFAKYYGTADNGARLDEPCHTVTVRDRFGHVQADLAAPEFSEEHEDRARAVADLLRDHGEWQGGEFVTLEIDGKTFVVVDIGMRMLTPRELFNAQGFPSDYVIEGVWQEQDGEWLFNSFPKYVQVSCCGNSVCPDVAAALVSANCEHLEANKDGSKRTAEKAGQ